MKQVFHKLASVLFLLVLCTSYSADADFQPKTYAPGEKLTYIAHFGWLNAGKAVFTVQDSVFEGKNLFHAVANAYSIGVADKIFEVRDVYESFYNPDSFQTHLAIRNISEGRYKYYNEVRYNYEDNKVISQKSGEHEAPENILDMLSAFYYFRESINDQTKVGDEIILDTYFADEIFPLKVRYVGDDKIKTKLGKFNSMKFSPVVEPGRIFDSEDDVTIWISKDKNHVPLQIRVDLMIGSIKCDLVKYSGLKYKLKKR